MIRLFSNHAARRLLSQHAVEKCGIMFPGLGPQYVGMARKLLPVPGVEELFEEVESVLKQPIKKLCLEGPQEELDRNINFHPAIMLSSLAALKKLEVEEPQCYEGIQFSAGFSLGEITAMVAAGALTLQDGAKAIQGMAKCVQLASDLIPGAMSSISGLDDDKVTQLCNESRNTGEVLHIAIYMFPGGRIVAGSLASVERLERAALKEGAKSVRRRITSGAFHCSHMEQGLEEYKEALSRVHFHPPKFSVYSNLTGLPHETDADMGESLCRQICEPVLWEQSIRHMLKTFTLTSIYELGPKRQLRTMFERTDANAAARLAKSIEA